MSTADQISDDARARMLELVAQAQSTQLAILDIAERETERINGAHKEASLTELRKWRAFVVEYGYQTQYEHLCEVVNGQGLERAVEPEQGDVTWTPIPPSWWVRVLLFFGFDAWLRHDK